MNIQDLITIIAVTIAVVALIFTVYRSFIEKRLPRAYSIAVVGYPQAGKTFLITAMFGELFSNRIPGNKTIPRGKTTIEKINKDLESIELGRPLGPTTDQDLFAYRADFIRGSFPFKRYYKVEIGDFPGEDSKEFAEKFGDWFHETPYFKWVMEANAFVFVIDLAPLLSEFESNEYAAKMTRAIRAAWQHLLEYHIEGNKEIRSKPLIIVFTKADLLFKYQDWTGSHQSTIGNIILEYGFKTIVNEKYENGIHPDQEIVKKIKDKFSDIINYLGEQSSSFNIEFVSALIRAKNGRLGIKDFLSHILPG